MKTWIAALSALALVAPAGAASAAPLVNVGLSAPVAAGQPNQSCQAQPNTPGKAAGAPGSAFNTSGTAGKVYAGQQPQNSRNSASVAQYDVACANQPGGSR